MVDNKITLKKWVKYLAGALISWGIAKYGLNVDAETTTALTVVLTSVFLAGYNYLKHYSD